MKYFALISYVGETLLPQYDNHATSGVPVVAGHLLDVLMPLFGQNIVDLGSRSKVADITSQLSFAAVNLDEDGFCLFYFHGHGDSIPGRDINDETMDQALVCYDDYLVDDEISRILQKFRPTQRLLTLIDCCSSETVIEWPDDPPSGYPKLIHIASANDGKEAYAIRTGGIFSRKILNLIYNGGYLNFSYKSFINRIKLSSITTECIVRWNNRVDKAYLNTNLFR